MVDFIPFRGQRGVDSLEDQVRDILDGEMTLKLPE